MPQLTLKSIAFAIVEGLRFDAAGDLWVASWGSLNVAQFPAVSLALPAVAGERMVAPAISLEASADISPTGRSIRRPGGLAFDPDGNLFLNSERGIANSNESAVVQMSAQQLLQLAGHEALQGKAVVFHATSNPGLGGIAIEPR